MIAFTPVQCTCKYQDGKSYLKQKYTRYIFQHKLDILAWAWILTGVSGCSLLSLFYSLLIGWRCPYIVSSSTAQWFCEQKIQNTSLWFSTEITFHPVFNTFLVKILIEDSIIASYLQENHIKPIVRINSKLIFMRKNAWNKSCFLHYSTYIGHSTLTSLWPPNLYTATELPHIHF